MSISCPYRVQTCAEYIPHTPYRYGHGQTPVADGRRRRSPYGHPLRKAICKKGDRPERRRQFTTGVHAMTREELRKYQTECAARSEMSRLLHGTGRDISICLSRPVPLAKRRSCLGLSCPAVSRSKKEGWR